MLLFYNHRGFEYVAHALCDSCSFTDNPPLTDFASNLDARSSWIRRHINSVVVFSPGNSSSRFLKLYLHNISESNSVNDPAAGSPTATLLRLTSYLIQFIQSRNSSSSEPSEIVTDGVYKLQGHIHNVLMKHCY